MSACGKAASRESVLSRRRREFSRGDNLSRAFNAGREMATRVFGCTGALAVTFLVLSLMAATRASAATPCDSVKKLKLPHVTIVDAQVVEARPVNSADARTLPSYCQIMATARPTSDSEIRLKVAIPLGSAWNGRYLQLGNGGF